MATFVMFVCWAAMIKSSRAVLTFIFGEDYKLSMFGSNLRKSQFHFDTDIALTNNGSYGAVPEPVLQEQRKHQVAA